MSGKVIQFPGQSDGPRTPQQWHEDLLDLHGRLSDALAKDRKQIDLVRMVLSIDDVMDLCRLIEDKLGPRFFDHD